MCGISGKINLDNKNVVESEITNMNAAIKHRGPDDSGVFIDGSTGLGNVRLAIIDLSPRGHMPMVSESGRYVITYNGEVYNYKENRRLLESRGCHFNSDSDTETILYLFQEFGVDCLKYLKGMFAFAIWDRAAHELFAAVDPFGKKPFKYYLDPEKFIFSSELKGILANGDVPREVDYQAIDTFLSLRYLPAPLTGFKNISKLPHGHYLIFKNGQLSIKRYAQVDFSQIGDRSYSHWMSQIQESLDNAIKSRILASDVLVGSFLSGGFDSSVVSAIAAKYIKLNTFTVGYEGSLVENELPWARKVADHIGSIHHELIIKPDVISDLSSIVKTYEEPFADPAAVPTYYLAKSVSSQVKVALTGDGGDELFLGYGKATNFAKCQPYFKIPAVFREVAAMVPVSGRAGFLTEVLSHRPSDAFLTNFGCWDNQIKNHYHFDKTDLYTADYLESTNVSFTPDLVSNIFGNAKSLDALDQTTYFDYESYLPDNNLPKVDLGFMAWGLEGRSPLLDDDLVKLGSAIPSEFRLGKKIFKDAFADLLPPEIVNRSKQGFSVPLNNWFRGELHDFLWSELLSDSFIGRNLFEKESLQQILQAQQSGDNNYDNHLWCLLTLASWFKVWEL